MWIVSYDHTVTPKEIHFNLTSESVSETCDISGKEVVLSLNDTCHLPPPHQKRKGQSENMNETENHIFANFPFHTPRKTNLALIAFQSAKWIANVKTINHARKQDVCRSFEYHLYSF